MVHTQSLLCLQVKATHFIDFKLGAFETNALQNLLDFGQKTCITTSKGKKKN